MKPTPLFTSFALILVFASSGVFADRFGGGGNSGYSSSGGNSDGSPMTDDEITCLLKKVDVKDNVAKETGVAIKDALNKLKFDSSKFTRASLMQFLAQIKAESAGGSVMTEKAPKSADKTGYGLIQVTGKDNLQQAEKCAAEAGISECRGMASNPEGKLGQSAPNKFCAAVASFCWWKANMLKNEERIAINKSMMEEDSRKISQIVNTGDIKGEHKMTGGVQNANAREGHFSKIKNGENSCRQYSI